MDSAMDLSLRNTVPSPPLHSVNPIMLPSPLLTATTSPGIQIVRPIPRPPWSILWYQNLWSISSSSDPSRQKISESDCDGNSDGGKKKPKGVLRTNERSSFSVLNNLSINTVNNLANSNNNNNCNFQYESLDGQQLSHRLFQSPTDKCYFPMSETQTLPLAASSSLFRSKQDSSAGLQHQWNSSTIQEKGLRDEYSSEDNDDSDNSENIVVTTTPSYQTRVEKDSIVKSSSSSSLDNSDASITSSRIHDLHQPHQTTVILDVACCDGPVQFKRISNPNFALTVEHNEVCPPSFPVTNGQKLSVPHEEGSPHLQPQHRENHGDKNSEPSCYHNSATAEGEKRYHEAHHSTTVEDVGDEQNTANAKATASSTAVTTHKSYLCIYCNQSFKSLFCYQKHKKRHLNPVSVDITTTTSNSTSYRGSSGVGSSHKKGNISGGVRPSGGGGGGGGGGNIGTTPENAKAKTKDLNVQFFPCKKCGCKFPSYYFVHKHRKICH